MASDAWNKRFPLSYLKPLQRHERPISTILSSLGARRVYSNAGARIEKVGGARYGRRRLRRSSFSGVEIDPSLIRLSVGIEDAHDLIGDWAQALG